ncbi:MAG: ABC transporter ATP-binding protein [Aquincola tertiaricarbonis]
MASVSLKKIHKTYAGGVHIIKGIDLEIADGEFMVFVGPSGCGKSTMMRMIAGLEDITAGELRIGDRLANDLPPVERKVAMVFQSYALYPHMTVGENMGFGLKINGATREEVNAAVGRAAEVLQITHLLDRRPKALSGGQRQRVAIGRAIVRKPGVFLFDEPLSNLDAGLRVQMRVELAKLHKELGTTMIYVTHDQTEAMTLGNRIAVFNGGHIEQVGPPMELYQQPANTFVAAFLGSPKMNLLPCDVHSADGVELQVKLSDRAGFSFGRNDAARYQGKSRRMTVGVRPESLGVASQGAGIAAEVVLVERLGDVQVVHARVAGTESVATVKLAENGSSLAAGQQVVLRPEPGSCYLFDENGKAA